MYTFCTLCMYVLGILSYAQPLLHNHSLIHYLYTLSYPTTCICTTAHGSFLYITHTLTCYAHVTHTHVCTRVRTRERILYRVPTRVLYKDVATQTCILLLLAHLAFLACMNLWMYGECFPCFSHIHFAHKFGRHLKMHILCTHTFLHAWGLAEYTLRPFVPCYTLGVWGMATRKHGPHVVALLLRCKYLTHLITIRYSICMYSVYSMYVCTTTLCMHNHSLIHFTGPDTLSTQTCNNADLYTLTTWIFSLFVHSHFWPKPSCTFVEMQIFDSFDNHLATLYVCTRGYTHYWMTGCMDVWYMFPVFFTNGWRVVPRVRTHGFMYTLGIFTYALFVHVPSLRGFVALLGS